MKRSTFLKAVFSVALILGTMSVFAQDGTFQQGTSHFVTVGYELPYYSNPDMALNPSYVFDEADYTDGTGYVSTWLWTLDGAGFTADATLTQLNNSNLVKVQWNTAGTYVLNVVEQGTSCNGAQEDMAITVCATPTIGTATADASFCGNTAAQTINYDITETNVTDARAGYFFNVTERIINTDGAGTEVGAELGGTPTTTLKTSTIASAELTRVGADGDGTYTYALTTSAVDIVGGLPTKYEYTVSAIQSQVSRRSEYFSATAYDIPSTTWSATYTDYTDHDAGAHTVAFYVYPTPTTGPIYTVPNL